MTQNNTTGQHDGPSILDMLEDARQRQNSVNSMTGGASATEIFGAALESVREIQRSVRSRMDAGLTRDEMAEARAVAEGAQAAETILNKLMA